MPPTSWDPPQYLKFERERARAFHDLVARIGVPAAGAVTDLGCGPGQLTATLSDRWPAALVTGVDSSAEMIEAATPLTRPGRLEFVAGTIEEWRPAAPVDVIVSNAALQWVPSHVDLCTRWLAEDLAPGGTLAFQVPATGGSPATTAIRAVAGSARWAGRLGGVVLGRGPRSAGSPVLAPAGYVDVLARLGCVVDAWETTYLHVLEGDDAVAQWFAGTGLRPYLDALGDDPEAAGDFFREVADALREAYPPAPYGTVLPFRRIFVVARRTSAGT